MLHEDITRGIIGAAMKVHSALGPGCLESTYSVCLCHQFTVDGLHSAHQVPLPVVYEGVPLNAGYRIDFLVEDCVIVELKAVEQLLPVHTAQMITYLKLSDRRVGLLINFNVSHLRDGIQRIVNGYSKDSVRSVSSVVEILGSSDTSGR